MSTYAGAVKLENENIAAHPNDVALIDQSLLNIDANVAAIVLMNGKTANEIESDQNLMRSKAIGDAILPGVSAADRPLVTGVILVGLIGLVIALIAFLRLAGTQAFRERPGSAVIQLVLALLVGFLYGAFIGAVTAITFAWRPAFGLGLSIAYALWSVFLLIDLARTGIDQEALKERFYPSRTIDTTKETLEWLQKRMPRENES